MRAHLVEKTCDGGPAELDERQRQPDAERNAERELSAALRDHYPHDVSLRGAERQSDAELLTAAANGEGRHAVEPHGRKYDRDRAENGKQRGDGAGLRERGFEVIPRRLEAVDRQVRLNLRQFAAQRVSQSLRRLAAARHEREVAQRQGFRRNEYRGAIAPWFERPLRQGVRDDYDNRAPGVALPGANPAPERTFIAEVFTRERFVHQDHEPPFAFVVRLEFAAGDRAQTQRGEITVGDELHPTFEPVFSTRVSPALDLAVESFVRHHVAARGERRVGELRA